MAVQLQQTDLSATDGAIAACSPDGAGSAIDNRTAKANGTPGVSTPTISCSSNIVVTRIVHFETAVGELDSYLVPAGNWVCRFNITTAFPVGTTLDSVYICRVNSSGVSQATIASVTSLGITLDTTGVKSTTLSGIAQTPLAGDRIYIIYELINSTTGVKSGNYTPNQLIDTPMVAREPERPFTTQGSFQVLQAVPNRVWAA